mmetsp:Transcript_41943/g.48976  ORF Transcript_41943/g.48976 Transcript_41943/m.48976 type:complete len:700 (-) Transcript_41943:326-2425(-)
MKVNKSAPSAIVYSAVSVTENEQVDEKYATMKRNNGLKADTYESVKVTEDDVKKFFSILNFIFTLRAIIKAIGKIINGNPSQFEKELISQFVVVHHHDKNHLEVSVESDKDLRSRYAHAGAGRGDQSSSAYSDHSDLAQSLVCTMVASGIFYGVMSYLQFMVDASKWLESSNDSMWDKDNQTFLAYSSVFALGLVAMLSGNYSAYLSNKQGEAKSKGTTTIFVKTVCYVFLLSFISIVSYDRVSSVFLSMPFASGEMSNWITKNVTVAGLSFTTTFLFAAGCRTIGLRFFSSSPIICMNEFSNLQNARLLEESSSVVFEDIEVNGHVRETNSRDDNGDDDRNNGRGNDDDNNGRGEDDPGKVMQLIKLYRFFNDRKNGRGNDDDNNNGRGNDDDDNGRGNDDDNNGRDNGRGEDDPGKVEQLIVLLRELATSIEETLKIMEEIKELIDGKRIISFAISCQVWIMYALAWTVASVLTGMCFQTNTELFLNWLGLNALSGTCGLGLVVLFTTSACNVPPAFLAFSSGFIFSDIFGFRNSLLFTQLGVFNGANIGAIVSYGVGYFVMRPCLISTTSNVSLNETKVALKNRSFLILVLCRLSNIITFGKQNLYAGIFDFPFTALVWSLLATIPGILFYSCVGTMFGAIAHGQDLSSMYFVALIVVVNYIIMIHYSTRCAITELKDIKHGRTSFTKKTSSTSIR